MTSLPPVKLWDLPVLVAMILRSFADNADLPITWECRQHGIEARLNDSAYRPCPAKTRCHWDMVLERRPVSDLAQPLDQQLKELRAGRLIPIEQWLAMRNEQRR
jgi:hypothetical protein